ncbi:DDE-type integrase/transposase/recombinase [Saccharothrix lopnurensis]|uniref:DDE-type integrase/transposase/recombinase n=1 Tax=Saccharothrix lopnurensis TaxID=1670621 RepID=A0ABW1NY49_9PSEU
MVSAENVAEVMAGTGIEAISPRAFEVRTTTAGAAASFPPDPVEREFDQDRPDAVWLTDITYLSCGEGDVFLCATRDGHSRKVLGYSVADHIGAGMVTKATEAAVAVRGERCRGTVPHSDRGGEGGFTWSSQHP